MTQDTHHTVRQNDSDEQDDEQQTSPNGRLTRYSIVRKNATKIARLPNPMEDDDTWFQLNEVDISLSLLLRLQSSRVVKSRDGENAKQWKIKENAYAEAVKHATDRSTFECGCTGITNVPGGGIECSDCGIEYPREIVEAVLSSQIQ